MTDRRPTLVEVGVPMRLGSISGGRFDLAPDAIRRAVGRFVARRGGERPLIVDLGVTIEDVGNHDEIPDMTPEIAFDQIRRAMAVLREDDQGHASDRRTVLQLGGDNSITRPGVHGAAFPGGLDRVGLLTLDAHHDLRPLDGGLTNGNPVRALLEDGLPGRNVVQIGIQPLANPAASAGVASRAGITVITAEEARARGAGEVAEEALKNLATRVDAIYVDLDVDVLDRAFAPACPGARPGGLTPADVQVAARVVGAHPKVRAMDLVEVDPERDVGDITVMAAASFVLAFASGLAAREGGG